MESWRSNLGWLHAKQAPCPCPLRSYLHNIIFSGIYIFILPNPPVFPSHIPPKSRVICYIYTLFLKGWGYNSAVEHLLCMYEFLASILGSAKKSQPNKQTKEELKISCKQTAFQNPNQPSLFFTLRVHAGSHGCA